MHGYPNLHPTFVRFVNARRTSGPRYPSGTLSGPSVPAECWDVAGFKALHDQALVDAQQDAAAFALGNDDPSIDTICKPGMTQAQCESALFDSYLSYVVDMECSNNFYTEPVPNTPCTSAANIMAAQQVLRDWVPGLAIDGVWGAESAAALAQSGYRFEDLIIECTPPAPSYKAGAGAAVQPVGDKDGSDGLVTVTHRDEKKGISGWWWAAIGGVAAAGVAVVVASRSEYADNPTRGPRRQSLKQALRLAYSGEWKSLARAVNYLDGMPVGGWPETQQAWGQIEQELPVRSARSYTVDEFVDATYYIDQADRYRTRK